MATKFEILLRRIRSAGFLEPIEDLSDVADAISFLVNRDLLLADALELVETVGTVTGAARQGLSATFPAGNDIAAAGGIQSFDLPIPNNFFEMQTLELSVTNINPGPGIGSFDIALYKTPSSRAAGTFSASDIGLQFLATSISIANSGPDTFTASVLGVMQGSNEMLYGRIRNNDASSAFDGTIAIEAYSRFGERAI